MQFAYRGIVGTIELEIAAKETKWRQLWKGRENYLCLLNLEDAVGTASGGFMNQNIIPLGLVPSWIALASTSFDVLSLGFAVALWDAFDEGQALRSAMLRFRLTARSMLT